MADDFEKAVLFGFDHSGAVAPALKEQAMAFLSNTKQLPNVWQLCIERFSLCAYQEVKFWCLQTLREVLQRSWTTMDPADQLHIRSALSHWLTNDCVSEQPVLPHFLKNKVIQIVIEVLRADYPTKWPTFFEDLIATLGRGVGMADVFARVLLALDEEVISLEIPRGPEELAVSMRIKDAMRGACVFKVVDAVRDVVAAHHASSPEVAGSILEGFSRYISWIDISLVVNDQTMPVFLNSLSDSSSAVRAGALSCVLAVVAKRMDPSAKMQLVHQLGLCDLAVALAARLEAEAAVSLRVTTLLTALAQELLDCYKETVSSPARSSAMPLSEQVILSHLDQLFPSILRRLEDDDADVCAATLPFLNAYVSRIKRLEMQDLPTQHVAHLQQILVAVARRCRFPEGYEFDTGTDPAGVEMEARVLELRQELFTIYRNVTKLVPQQAYALVGRALTDLLQRDSSAAQDSFQEVEMVLVLLYELGVGISEEAVKPGSGALGLLVAPLLAACEHLPAATHRLVALNLMELAVRYVRLLQQQPEYLGSVLRAFLGKQGLQHPNRAVSGRACYLFVRLVKNVRGQLAPFTDSIMATLAAALPVIMASPSARSLSAGGTDDHLYLFEAGGLLISYEDIASPQLQHSYLASLLTPMIKKVEAALGACAAGDQAGSPSTTEEIQHAVVALGHLSKGFTTTLVNVKNPDLGNLLQEALEASLRVLRQLPLNRTLRSRITSFVHRMVDCLATRVFPLLWPTVQLLLTSAEASDVCNVLTLLNQLTAKFKGGVEALLIDTLEAVLAQTDAVLAPARAQGGAAALPNTEAVREASDVKQAYHLLLNTIANASQLPAMLRALDQPRLERVLSGLVEDAAHHAAPTMCKLCVSTLRMVVMEWCGGAGEAVARTSVADLHNFVIQQVGRATAVRGALSGTLNIRDANGSIVFGELVQLQRLLCERCGEAFLAAASMEVTQLGFSPEVVQQYIQRLQGTEVRVFKEFVKWMWEELQKGNTAAPEGGMKQR